MRENLKVVDKGTLIGLCEKAEEMDIKGGNVQVLEESLDPEGKNIVKPVYRTSPYILRCEVFMKVRGSEEASKIILDLENADFRGLETVKELQWKG